MSDIYAIPELREALPAGAVPRHALFQLSSESKRQVRVRCGRVSAAMRGRRTWLRARRVAGRDAGSGRLLNVEPTTRAKESVPWVGIFTGTFSTPAGRSLAAPGRAETVAS